MEKVATVSNNINAEESINQCKEYLTCEKLADMMGVSRTTVYRYCITGKIPCISMNRKIFIRKKDVDLLFDNPKPYTVSPVPRKPITEFYTLDEVIEKYKVSPTTVYNTVNAKRIPKVVFQGKQLYSRKHIDKFFSLTAPDPSITEWYSREEIETKYGLSTSGVYHLAPDNSIPRKNDKGRTMYSKLHIDALLYKKESNPEITEWYTMNDVVEIYKLSPRFVANLVCKNPIPKQRRGNKAYYSKEHFDKLMREKYPPAEYYTYQ